MPSFPPQSPKAATANLLTSFITSFLPRCMHRIIFRGMGAGVEWQRTLEGRRGLDLKPPKKTFLGSLSVVVNYPFLVWSIFFLSVSPSLSPSRSLALSLPLSLWLIFPPVPTAPVVHWDQSFVPWEPTFVPNENVTA